MLASRLGSTVAALTALLPGCATPRQVWVPVPVVQPPEGHFLAGMSDASPGERSWSCEDPRFGLDEFGGVLFGSFESAGEWPYALPERVECSSGSESVELRPAFVAPRAHPWAAADGTWVLPRPRSRRWASASFRSAHGRVIAAEVVNAPPQAGCEALEGSEMVRVFAGPRSTDLFTCRLVHGDGSTVDQAVAAPVYDDR